MIKFELHFLCPLGSLELHILILSCGGQLYPVGLLHHHVGHFPGDGAGGLLCYIVVFLLLVGHLSGDELKPLHHLHEPPLLGLLTA